MATLHIYDKLQQFALFQGMSKGDLGQLVAHTRLGFHKYAPGDVVASDGRACTALYFLIDGQLTITTSSTDRDYSVIEDVRSPQLFEPSSLFGLRPRFGSTYQAHTPCSVIVIDKDEIYRLLDCFTIFRLNFINLLSAHIQKQRALAWRPAYTTVRQRIIHFVETHCLYPAGAKRVAIRMTQLADEVGCSRLQVSQALNQLQAEQLISLYRGGFTIGALEKLRHG